MTEQIPATLIAGNRAIEVHVSPAQLYEHYRLMILVGEGSNAPKIRRAMGYVAEARDAGTFTAQQADRLDQIAEKALWTTEHPEEGRDDDEW